MPSGIDRRAASARCRRSRYELRLRSSALIEVREKHCATFALRVLCFSFEVGWAKLLARGFSWPPGSIFRINLFPAEPRDKFQRMFLFSETPNIDPLIVAKERMATRAKR